MTGRSTLLIACVILHVYTMPVHTARACDTGTVRDAAFFGARDHFWLGMVFDEADDASRERYAQLSAWLAEEGAALNIQAEHILPDDAMYLRLRYGVAAPPELPTTFLAGRHPAESRPVVFAEWMPAPELAMLEDLKTNPLLTRITEVTPEFWGGILYARGAGAERRGEIAAVAEQWKQNHAPGVSVIEVDRIAPENRLLCAVAGIEENGEDWAGVVFGKGKLMMPVLVGDAITGRELDRLLNRLMVPCTCLQQATIFGLDMPMFWEDTLENRPVELAAPLGYMEMTLDDKLASVLTELPGATQSLNSVVIMAIGVLGFLALLSLSITWVRLRQR